MPKEFFVNVHTPADCQKERHSVNVYGTASYVENAAEDFHIFADRKSTRLNSSHDRQSRMPSSA